MSKKAIQLTDSSGNDILPISADSGSGYLKLADGTMICWGASAFVNCSKTVTFPKTFISQPYAFCIPRYPNGADHMRAVVNTSISTNAASFYETAFANGTPTFVTAKDDFYWLAIGRWK